MICVSDDIRPIIYVPYVYLVKFIYFIFFFFDATDYGEIKMNIFYMCPKSILILMCIRLE